MVTSLDTKKDLIVKLFANCGLLSGYRDVSKHVPRKTFDAVVLSRDVNILQIKSSYVTAQNSLSGSNIFQGLNFTQSSPQHQPKVFKSFTRDVLVFHWSLLDGNERKYDELSRV